MQSPIWANLSSHGAVHNHSGNPYRRLLGDLLASGVEVPAGGIVSLPIVRFAVDDSELSTAHD